ncbi:MAG: hypothetical protein JXN64_06665 [Spirochaetes bacterium]|nr:hypothetical protein [Spirochaetota bacterium]
MSQRIKNILKFIILISLIYVSIIIIFPLSLTTAQTKASPNGVAVFGIPNNYSSDIALTAEAVERVKKVFADCGRFMPVSREVETAYSEAKKDMRAEENIYTKTAKLLDLDLYIMLSAYQLGNFLYSDISIVPINHQYKYLEKKIRLRSKIKFNISLKAGKEIAILHYNLPVSAAVIKVYENDTYLINAGEWQGIKNNEKYRLPDCDVQIIKTGRFESIVKISAEKKEGDKLQIDIFPDVNKIVDELDEDISRNTINRYELGTHGEAEKRFIEGICVVNMCGNVCVPSYGAFLSTSYLGFKDSKADLPGVALSATIIAGQLLLPELMTDFKVNFFPWKQDSNKTEKMQDLQKFLWLSLPITFSTAYMDQLAYQFRSTEHLPPFFKDKDNIAAIFSLFLPGGGLFYKGHRLAGWSFYFSEMAAAAYTVYNYGSDSSKYALYALGIIKLIDIAYAYITSPSYSFYNLEKERKIEPVSLNMGIKTGHNRDQIYNIIVTSAF